MLVRTIQGKEYAGSGNAGMSRQFKALQETIGCYIERRGPGALRHTFESAAQFAADQESVDLIMGHERPGMSARYREIFPARRLIDCVDVVRDWLQGRISEPVVDLRRREDRTCEQEEK